MQDRLFLDGEGDQWFLRNRRSLERPQPLTDPVLGVLDGLVAPSDVIEIGASNGYRLHELHVRHGCSVTAVEPSLSAIEDGRSRYGEVDFVHGVASSLPDEFEARFDLAIVNFVLHWIDRSALLRSVAEIDRVLKDGGFLVIGDFYPARPERVPYHHLPDQSVWTFKQDYHDIFLASQLYETVTFASFDHAGRARSADVEPQHRAQAVLLRKTLSQRYTAVTLT